ncbi:MAG: hypothetical protein GX041_08645 [Clostridiales bacterium]|nr:hypothetical protein [Clostridiales bacterium]
MADSAQLALLGDRLDTYPPKGLSLAFDHRASNGAPAARFFGSWNQS